MNFAGIRSDRRFAEMAENTRIIELVEYQPHRLEAHALSEADARFIYDNHGSQINVEPPSFKNNNAWVLTSEGWSGYIPLESNLVLSLVPKVPISNIFRMLEYAYRLRSFEFLEDIYLAGSMREFYNQLACLLSKKVLERGRNGYYRAYVERNDQLPFVAGRIDIQHHIRRPWSVSPQCQYHDHAADVVDNQLLAWTLFGVARSGLCSEEVSPIVRKAYRNLQSLVSLQPFSPADCLHRLYTRLNQDYHPMHALCRFFLENAGPTHHTGGHEMLPFLVNMPRLFELFVAEWLYAHLPAGLELKIQEKVEIRKEKGLHFEIDLVLYEQSGEVRSVLDTKYKAPEGPGTSDIAQVVTYATMKRCHEGVLIYPIILQQPLDEWVDDIRLRTLSFCLDGDLEKAGEIFMGELLSIHQPIN